MMMRKADRYKVGVPWKDDHPKLPNNYHTAANRLKNTECKLRQETFVQSEYQKILESYISKGYLRKVSPEEKRPQKIWYLPHFPIVRMDKSTTKVRMVFDCSAKTQGVLLTMPSTQVQSYNGSCLTSFYVFDVIQLQQLVTSKKCTCRQRQKKLIVHFFGSYGEIWTVIVSQMCMSSVEWSSERILHQWRLSMSHRRMLGGTKQCIRWLQKPF